MQTRIENNPSIILNVNIEFMINNNKDETMKYS